MIQLQDVTKVYSKTVRAVSNLSLTIQEGEILGLIGTSGCGKTTTLKMINRLVKLTYGSIFIDGTNITSMEAVQLRRNIGYVIQDVGLFPHYTIQENIAVVPKLLNWKQQKINQRCNELLDLVGLSPNDFRSRRPEELSGGQQQRVGFARALAGDPQIILMDEPFGALDPITKENIRDEFKNLLDQINKTIVLVTHDVAEAFDLCDRVALMDSGRLQQVGTPRELLLKPENNFVSSFFDVNRLELEMQAITMKDLLSASTIVNENVAESETLSATIDDSVADVLNRREATKKVINYITVVNGDKYENIKMDELFSTFYKVRDTIMGENYG